MAGFRFPQARRHIARVKPATFPKEIKTPEEQLTLIQGKSPGSTEEWRVAMALYRLKHVFLYQYEVFGGRMTGGQIIDFWVIDTQMPTAIYMNGRAWHNNKNQAADDYKIYKLKKIYHGLIREPIIIWDDQVPTVAAAVALLRKEL